MRVLRDPREMRSATLEARREGRRVGFVPTMGALHEGHLSLVRVARSRADAVVMSIFVNPLQFGPGEDFERYPRDLEKDAALASPAGVDLLWVPERAAMYPEPPLVTVAPGPMADGYEGAVRPGHFAGVLTVVLKLLNVVQPDVAVFGRKDVQQAALVRRMAADLDVPVELVVAPTVRESDGLAMSSRNVYLDADGRRRATALSRALEAGVRAFRGGERGGAALAEAARAVLRSEPAVEVDYVACVDPLRFAPVERADASAVLVLAARVGGTRLLDNAVLGEGLEGDERVGR